MLLAQSSILKRVYDGLVLFAVLNVLGLAGLGAFLVSTGAVNGEKLRRIVSVMRGEELDSDEVEQSEQPVETDEEAVPGAAAETVFEPEIDVQIMRLEGERIKAELDQRLALNNSILLRVMTERERFRGEQDEATRQQQLSTEQRSSEGFKKQIAIYEALSPKIALEHLLGISEPDEAAGILLEMNTRRAKKIIEAAKRGGQMAKMRVILQRVREVAPDRAGELDTGEE